MKKTLLAAIVVAIAGLTSCNEKQQNTNIVPAITGEVAALPIAYVNLDSLLSGYNFAMDLNEELIKKTEDARATLNSRASALEKEMADFNRKLQTNAFLSQDRAQSEANRLQKKQDELEQLNAKLQNDLAQDQMLMNARLSDTIQVVLKEFNEVKHFELIISNTMHDNILLDNPKYDITGELLEILNARYEKAKK